MKKNLPVNENYWIMISGYDHWIIISGYDHYNE